MRNLAFILSSFAFFSCGDDGAPESTTTITQDQAQAIADALGLLGDLEFSETQSKLSSPRLQTAISGTDSDTDDCDISGTIVTETTGSGTQTSSSVQYTTSGKVTFNACTQRVTLDSQMILDGKLTTSGSGSVQKSVGTISESYNGGLTVSGTDIVTGVCGISIKLTISSSDGETINPKVSGTICERKVTSAGN